jgi:3-methylcrotonyl-CoA carboxylase alpha subunit
MPFEAEVDGKTERFLAISQGGETSIVFRDDRAVPPAGIPPTVLTVDHGALVLNGGRQTHVRPIDPEAAAEVGVGTSDGAVKAPMHGRLAALAVTEGQEVEAGERVAVLEAMKMEHALAAPRAGRVALADKRIGDIVEQGALILRVEEVAQEA